MLDIALGNEPVIVTGVPPVVSPEVGEIPVIEFNWTGSGGGNAAAAITK